MYMLTLTLSKPFGSLVWCFIMEISKRHVTENVYFANSLISVTWIYHSTLKAKPSGEILCPRNSIISLNYFKYQKFIAQIWIYSELIQYNREYVTECTGTLPCSDSDYFWMLPGSLWLTVISYWTCWALCWGIPTKVC